MQGIWQLQRPKEIPAQTLILGILTPNKKIPDFEINPKSGTHIESIKIAHTTAFGKFARF